MLDVYRAKSGKMFHGDFRPCAHDKYNKYSGDFQLICGFFFDVKTILR